MNRFLRGSPLPAVGALVTTIVLWFGAVHADDRATIEVTVERADGEPAAGARVTLVELRRSGITNYRGKLKLDDVPPGEYHLQGFSERFGESVEEISVTAGERLATTLVLGYSGHRERIVVTATRAGRGSAEVVMPVQVIDQKTLSEKLQPTVGETLAAEPGVSSNYFGPGASRPVIRGQGGGRIRVLEGGLGVGDASTTSPDHAVATDTIAAEQIEILRGPATLLYGSSALGGVVNILDRRVPERAPPKPLSGTVNLRYGSAADEKSAGVALNGGVGHLAFHVDALDRRTDDYDIPGQAVEGDPGSPFGTLRNSSVESSGGTLGLSLVGEQGFVGASVKTFDTNYGIPVEDEIRIDLQQNRYDLRGAVDRRFGPFNGLRVSLGATDYEHRELEGAQVGTTFLNETGEGRVELTHGEAGPWTGVFGLQYQTREFETIGDEAFLPPSDTEAVALFALEEIESGNLRYEVGARVESTDVETPAALAADPACAAPLDREFDGVSGSFGIVWSPNERYALGSSLSRAVRSPSAEELFACGAHLATLSFEIGDPDLGEERNIGVDVNLRRRTGRVTGEVSLFGYRYDDYVYEESTGLQIDGLDAFRFVQADAEFYGAELRSVIELVHRDGHDLDLELGADFVEAELSDTNEPLPRIPTTRGRFGLSYRTPSWQVAVGATRYDDQNDNAPTETPTKGYTTVEASVGYRLVARGVVHDFTLRGTNLTDEKARNHPSRLKDLVPLPGADVAFIYRLIF